MSFSHLLILGIIAVIVIPPDKLPEVARQFAKFLGDMRRMTAGIFDDLKQENILKPQDLFKNNNHSGLSFPPPVAPASKEAPVVDATIANAIEPSIVNEVTPEKKTTP